MMKKIVGALVLALLSNTGWAAYSPETIITDPAGVNQAAVKAASTAPIATDPALVVGISPNSTVAVTGTFWQATQPVSAAALPLPAGAATQATLAAIAAQLPATLGQKTMANSLACVLPSDQSAIPVTGTFWQATQPISAAALPLPAGAATSALQSTANTSLASIDTKTPALGQTTKSASSPVTIASDQAPIVNLTTTGTLPSLNSVVAVSTSGYSVVGLTFTGTWSGTISAQATVDGANWQLVQGWTNQNSVSVNNFSSNYSPAQNGQTVIFRTDGFAQFRVTMSAYTSGTANITLVQGTGQGPTFGYVSSRILDSAGNNIAIGQTTMANSLPVAIASNQSAIPIKDAVNANGSGSAAGATVSTVITLTAPANATGFILMNLDTSTANIRWAIGRTATTTLGQQLQPGRDTTYVPCGHDVTLVAESGTQNYDIQWVSQ